MKIERIEVSSLFGKGYKRLPQRIKDIAKEKEFIFKNNPFDPRLDTHKLHGKDKEAWAFSINRAYRLKFIFLDERSVLFLEIGTHEIYN